jgi:hypothetical protein
MAEIQRKEVVLSSATQADIKAVFEFGVETFGLVAAKAFVAEVYMSIWGLDYQSIQYAPGMQVFSHQKQDLPQYYSR